MQFTTNHKLALLSVSVLGVIFILFLQPFENISNNANTENTATETIREYPVATVTQEALEEMADQIEKEIKVKEAAEERERQEEEITEPETESQPERANVSLSNVPDYIRVTGACGAYYQGDCLNVRAAASTDSEVVSRLRNGIVLKVDELVEQDGRQWYKIIFDEWLRHPDRLTSDWYVAAEFVHPVEKESLDKPTESEDREKRIEISLSEQMLYAYEGGELFMAEPVSTGSVGAVTPRGRFSVFYRTPSRYMQGPIPGITDDNYDLPGVPWNLYFTQQGAVIHGAYWHDNFGQNFSHGCVNLPPEKAQKLYGWTPEGTEVLVRD